MKRIELLSPAGSGVAARSAINAGADAIYIGGNLFGARAYAKNPEREELISVIEYAHIHGSRVYLTVNTLLKSHELESLLYDYLDPYYENGLDGVIVQDLGVFSFIKEHFPGLELHCSTQMTISDLTGARFMKEKGADRVVLSRELSLDEIREITAAGIETECFIHGALCYCYSGQCLMSSIFGGRSGNRGRCAQPCRLPYDVSGKKKYILSPKDLCTIDFLPELIDAGIYSFKIEGRMKRAEYTAAVTSIYRKYIELALSGAEYKVDTADMEVLLKAGNRGGFTDGYYKTHNGANMISVNKPDYDTGDEAFFKAFEDRFVDKEKKEKISGKAVLQKDKPAFLEVSLGGHTVSAEGDMVSPAVNAPLDIERVDKQLRKTGDTPFEFHNLDIDMEGDIFIPMGALNSLRREALSKLQEEILSGYYPKDGTSGRPKMTDEPSAKPGRMERDNSIEGSENSFTVYIENLNLLDTVLKWDISRVYIDSSCFASGNIGRFITLDIIKAREIALKVKESGKEAFLAMPYIFRKDIRESFEGNARELADIFDGFLIRNIDQLGFLREAGLNTRLISDYRLYGTNAKAAWFLKENGVEALCAPVELNEKELAANEGLYGEILSYGHIPLMISAQCVRNTISGCNRRNDLVEFKDRYKKSIFARSVCAYCYSVIYNGTPMYLSDSLGMLQKAGIHAFRLEFTKESPEEAEKVFSLFKEGKGPKGDFTRGHFTRGVE